MCPWHELMIVINRGTKLTFPNTVFLIAVKKSIDAGMIPLECLYLSRNAYLSVAGQPIQAVKHFALKRKPKSAALRAELLQKCKLIAVV